MEFSSELPEGEQDDDEIYRSELAEFSRILRQDLGLALEEQVSNSTTGMSELSAVSSHNSAPAEQPFYDLPILPELLEEEPAATNAPAPPQSSAPAAPLPVISPPASPVALSSTSPLVSSLPSSHHRQMQMVELELEQRSPALATQTRTLRDELAAMTAASAQTTQQLALAENTIRLRDEQIAVLLAENEEMRRQIRERTLRFGELRERAETASAQHRTACAELEELRTRLQEVEASRVNAEAGWARDRNALQLQLQIQHYQINIITQQHNSVQTDRERKRWQIITLQRRLQVEKARRTVAWQRYCGEHRTRINEACTTRALRRNFEELRVLKERLERQVSELTAQLGESVRGRAAGGEEAETVDASAQALRPDNVNQPLESESQATTARQTPALPLRLTTELNRQPEPAQPPTPSTIPEHHSPLTSQSGRSKRVDGQHDDEECCADPAHANEDDLRRRFVDEMNRQVQAEHERMMEHCGRVGTANVAAFLSSGLLFSAGLGMLVYSLVTLRRCAVMA